MQKQTAAKLDQGRASTTTLSIDAFVRSITVNRGRPICLLLGAGASLTSGMPSAERCIWDWKRDIFVSNNPTLRDTVGELTLSGTRSRIQSWLDQQGHYPRAGHDSEYSYYAETCYPSQADRRSFFRGYVRQASPHTGYRLIPLLVKSGLLRTIWTTNFDSLASRACAAADVVCIEIGMDTAERTLRPPAVGELRVVSMHGDYRYDALKNTAAELLDLELEFRRELKVELKDCDLVVLGYSGRDRSVMDTLHQVFSEAGHTRLFWCGFGDDVALEVGNLISTARNSGREAYYIPTEGFDDTVTRLSLSYLDTHHLAEAKSIIETYTASQPPGKLFACPPLEPTTLFKSNAYPLGYPREILKVELHFPSDVHRGRWLNQKLEGKDACGVVTSDGAFLLGDSAELQNALAGYTVGQIIAHAVSDEDMAKDRRIRSVIRKGLVIAFRRLLAVGGNTARIWAKNSYEVRRHAGQAYRVHRALKPELVFLSGQPLAVLTPEVVIFNTAGGNPPIFRAR